MLNWKSRYAELLEKQERQLEQHKRKTALMLSALSSMGVLAKGIDPGANEKVSALQTLLREKKIRNTDLEPLVNALTRQAESSLNARRATLKLIKVDLKLMSKRARSATDDEASIRSLKAFEHALSRNDTEYTDTLALVNQLLRLQGKALKHPKESSASLFKTFFTIPFKTSFSKTSFSKTSFSKTSFSKAPASKNETEALVDSNIPLESNTHEALTKILSEFLYKLAPPEHILIKYYPTLKSLAALKDIAQLPPLALDFCEIVSATLKTDHDDFEIFLNQMNERLREMTQNLIQSKGHYEIEMNANKQLDESIRLSVGRMKSSVSSAVDLEVLKTEVSANISQMVNLMDSHREEGKDRNVSLSAELISLTERVKYMEEAVQLADEKIAEQRAIALTDALTKLPNRQAYTQRAAEEIARWQRYERPLCLAVCDIDLFKRVNDDYGHAAGDEVLSRLANELKSRIRESDFVARFGGEEFVFLLPETEAEQALALMEALRSAIESLPIVWEEQRIKVSISVGIVAFQGKDNLASAFTRADRALYQAKDAGRNRCIVASDVSLRD